MTGGKKPKKCRLSTIILTVAIANCILLLLLFTWHNYTSITQSTLISELKARISDMESQEQGGAELYDVPCHSCDKALSRELNKRFNFFVLNLDRRPDKMRCVRDQFANFGIHVRRMHGIDSLRMDIPKLTLLPTSVKQFLGSHPDQVGHVGCLYGHIRFMMSAAAGKDGCGGEDKSLRSDESGLLKKNWIGLTLRNRWHATVEVYWIGDDGTEHLRGTIPPEKDVLHDTAMNQAWRVRDKSTGQQVLQLRLEHHETPSSAYTMDQERTHAVAYIYGCPADDREKINIIFEDDVVLREDFAEKLLFSFDQMYEKQPNFDIFLLNWYCNSVHWKDCDKNKRTKMIAEKKWTDVDRRLYQYTSTLGKYTVTQVKFFMSGGGYAVSKAGAQKLLGTFPCDSSQRTCSMAVDWHMSTLIDAGLINVLGASPPFVLMPEMGSVQSLNIGTPPKHLMQTCGDYKSDTHFEDHAKPKVLGKDPHVRDIEIELENWKRNTKSMHSVDGVASDTGRYLALDKTLTWHQARSECKARNMELATIRDATENSEALVVAQKTCGHVTSVMAGWDLCAWIGLNDYDLEGTLVWADGSKSNYQNFVSGEPNNLGDEDGMALCWTFQGQWIDFSNTGSLPCILCQKNKG